MREWQWIIIGVVSIIVLPTIPALYVEYLWIQTRHDYPAKTAKTQESSHENQTNSHLLSLSKQPRPDKSDPIAQTHSDQRSDEHMTLTEKLLVAVGFLQFFGLIGQIIIYTRQAKIMDNSLKLNRDTLVSTFRPRVVIHNVLLTSFEPGNNVVINIAFVNTGGALCLCFR